MKSLQNLKSMTVSIIVDFKKGYWMVIVHPDSRKLTCMALPFGRFQSKLDAIFIGMEGVTGIADDMVIGRQRRNGTLQKFPSIHGIVYDQQPDS